MLTLIGQLQKMGILASAPEVKTSTSAKRKSGTLDLSTLAPLKSASTIKNFAGYRDANAAKNSVLRKLNKKRKDDDSDMDEDDDDDDSTPKESIENPDEDKDLSGATMLSPEDALRQQSLAEGVQKINLVTP